MVPSDCGEAWGEQSNEGSGIWGGKESSIAQWGEDERKPQCPFGVPLENRYDGDKTWSRVAEVRDENLEEENIVIEKEKSEEKEIIDDVWTEVAESSVYE